MRSEKEFYNALPKEAKEKYFRGDDDDRSDLDYLLQSGEFRSSVNPDASWERDVDYKKMVTEAAKIYSSNKVIKDPAVGLNKFGDISGAGTFTTGRSTILVNPKAPDTASFYRYNEVLRDLSKFDFKTDQASIRGINVDAKEALSEDKNVSSLSNKIAESVLAEIRKEAANPYKTKMGNFKVQVSPIAFGSPNKAAVVIRPDTEWLKTLVYKADDGVKTSAGIINSDQYDMIIKNGISFVMNSNQMTNSMYTNSFETPLQSVINATGKYEYVDPINPDRTITYTPNKLGTGDYKATITYPYPDEQGNVIKETMVSNVNTFGTTLENHRSSMMNYFQVNQDALRNPLNQ